MFVGWHAVSGHPASAILPPLTCHVPFFLSGVLLLSLVHGRRTATYLYRISFHAHVTAACGWQDALQRCLGLHKTSACHLFLLSLLSCSAFSLWLCLWSHPPSSSSGAWILPPVSACLPLSLFSTHARHAYRTRLPPSCICTHLPPYAYILCLSLHNAWTTAPGGTLTYHALICSSPVLWDSVRLLRSCADSRDVPSLPAPPLSSRLH